MRINLESKNTQPAANEPAVNELGNTQRSAATSSTTGNSASQTSLGSDSAELSMDYARVASLASQINGLPEIRQEKVAALSNAIQQGTYDVSPEQTADAMLSEFLGNVA
jgi:negative regulator of flagellin synthesis FlgM